MAEYLVFLGSLGGVYALLGLGLNLSWGTAGLVNLGLAGFFAVGAYAAAIAAAAGAPFAVGLLLAAGSSLLAGLIVTVATLRLRDDYLAIVTLGFAEVVRLVALNERWLTNGADGISGIRLPLRPQLGPANASLFFLAIVTACAVTAWLGLRRLDRSAYGRTLKAIREDQELAAFAGKRVLRFKLQAFAGGAAIAGLAGALYAHLLSFVAPDDFDSLVTLYTFLAVTAGGVGRPLSALLGGYAVVLFLESTRFLGALLPGLQPLQVAAGREFLVGAALLLVLRLRPQGLLPERIPPAIPR